MPAEPSILTTTVGSYPIPDWLAALPSEQARLDATRVVFDLQRQAGIDLPTDGELYRFDVNHPDTNGMIEYFIRPMAGIRAQVGRGDHEAFARAHAMWFRRKAAGVVEAELSEGSLNLLADCELAASVAGGPFKFTVTSPYMLARTLLDRHYGGFEPLLTAIADVLARQVAGLPCQCLQVDEANIPGNPSDGPIAAAAINRVLDAFTGTRAVHLCFGNYGGQTIQKGEWRALIDFLNRLHADQLVLETAHRPASDLEALKEVDSRIRLGIGVVDVKTNHIETPEEIAAAIDRAEAVLGRGRVGAIHPDCGFWMLKRSVADRKIEALAKGRDLYLGPRMISFRDRATGAQVLQVTEGPAINHPTYFLQSSFFPGDREMFFTSYRTGAAQLFEASLETGEARQLTSGAPIHPYSAALHPDGETLVFTRGGGLWSIHRRTLVERCIADHSDMQRADMQLADMQLGECSISRDGEWLTAAFQSGGQSVVQRGLVCGRFDGTLWRAIPFPRTVIHPQFHPLEPEWIEFSGDPAPRMHRVRRDGTGLECLYRHGNDEFLVHETFLGNTGDLVFTVWPRALCRMDWTTREIRTIANYNAWHIAPDRAGGRVLCDTNHPDEGLQIIDASTGARRQLCLSESSNQGSQWRHSRYALAEDFAQARNTLSWMENAADTVYGPQWTHPHPSWSSDESKVAFASDRTGTTQVYIADVCA